MSADWIVVIVFGFPLLAVALGLGYAAFQRYLSHRERMAMIEKGIVPPDWLPSAGAFRPHRSVVSPVTITLVGVAITLGLLILGLGPWLIGGLVPTAYGCALLIRDLRASQQADQNVDQQAAEQVGPETTQRDTREGE